MAGKRKAENHKATPPILPSDTPCAQTLINWVKFDMCVCLQQRQRGTSVRASHLFAHALVPMWFVCFSVCSPQITGSWN